MQVTSYNLSLTPLRDAIVVLEGSDETPISHHSGNSAQFLKIRVASIVTKIQPFYFRYIFYYKASKLIYNNSKTNFFLNLY